ncbi:MAG: DNA-directed RNA polymerase subunit H [Candidatus Helarchaeota archaeon]|nr:DNA-directed RNA polymerase subunit H [Candidatus Helarchaeota archaeon]
MGNPKSKVNPLIEKTKVLMKNRGYTEDLDKKKSEENKMDFLYFKDGQGQQLIVHCTFKNETIGVAYIRDLVKKFDKKKIKQRIFIGTGKVTRSALNELAANKIEYIPADLVLMDILEHEFVPKHEILSKTETANLLEQLKVPGSALPGILITDPVARVIGAELGDVVKITRESETAGETIIYRLVVKEEL